MILFKPFTLNITENYLICERNGMLCFKPAEEMRDVFQSVTQS